MNNIGAVQDMEEKLLSQYCPPDFLIDTVKLEFNIESTITIVTSHIQFKRNGDHAKSLILDGGEALILRSIKLNDALLAASEYEVVGEELTVHSVPDHFDICIVTELYPEKNTKLEGLYKTSGNYCTQCEAEGFRHITYYLDRPDVMALFEVTIVADKADNPVMLSNGNLADSRELDGGKHYVKWVDPWPKPSYLFAVVAGKLSALSDSFKTKSGKDVALNIYVVEKDLPKCDYAMQSLIKSMQWDEDIYGLEYDLNVYNIVAVGDFNMGAMENKGLNVFNTKYVLADSQTATDSDYDHIQGVIGHEYFHNWTGNRVTCRDWFQLSLKEGLTVFRDQEFSSDMGSRAVKRLDDVQVLRSYQFPEDAGPLAHPIRPEKYVEINNFYTATVYNKGAEVIRMMHIIIGADNFRRGMDIYFERHDGQAVTCEDFISSMEAASGENLSQFRRWYSQAGTPVVNANGSYDATSKQYKLSLKQSCSPTPDGSAKEPFHMPVVVGLVGSNGHDMDVELSDGGTKGDAGFILNLRDEEQVFEFNNVSEKPVLSILRGFSAPVIMKNDSERSDTLFLLSNDSDSFARWEAGQTIARDSILDAVKKFDQAGSPLLPEDAVDAFGSIFDDKQTDPALLAEILTLPAESYLGQFMPVVDVDALHSVRKSFKRAIAAKYFDKILSLYQSYADYDVSYSANSKSKARRRLKNVALSYLVEAGKSEASDALEQQLEQSDNMTDRIAALSLVCHTESAFRDRALSLFYDQWRHDDLVLDKWFMVQACSQRELAMSDVLSLSTHPDFNIKNPNRVRSLVMAFANGNQVRFHNKDGDGYRFLSSMIDKLDKLNPQVAARMIAPLGQWRRFDSHRQGLMKSELEKLADSNNYSSDVCELSTRSLIA